MKNIAIVTGGSRGIGKAIAIQLAKDGYDIWLNYNHNVNAAEETKKQIESFNQECTLLQFDVASQENVKTILQSKIAELNKEKERLMVLVNNAGITKDNLFYWMSDNDWHDVINTNLNGFYYVTKSVIDQMILNKKGYIVNISSLSGEVGNIAQASYSAAKAGIIAATKVLAKELRRNNILVNSVTPGLIDTDMTEGIKNDKKFLKRIPLRRAGKVDEVAHVVSFLCSPKASYITGAIIPVNGGVF